MVLIVWGYAAAVYLTTAILSLIAMYVTRNHTELWFWIGVADVFALSYLLDGIWLYPALAIAIALTLHALNWVSTLSSGVNPRS